MDKFCSRYFGKISNNTDHFYSFNVGSRFFVIEQKKDPGADTQPVTVLVNWQSIVAKR